MQKFYPEGEEGGKNSAGAAVLWGGSVLDPSGHPRLEGLPPFSRRRKLRLPVPKGFEVTQKEQSCGPNFHLVSTNAHPSLPPGLL